MEEKKQIKTEHFLADVNYVFLFKKFFFHNILLVFLRKYLRDRHKKDFTGVILDSDFFFSLKYVAFLKCLKNPIVVSSHAKGHKKVV